MKKRILTLLGIFILSSCATGPQDNNTSPENVLKNYSIQTLANGLNLLFIKDDRLPYLTLSAFVMNGYAMDPASRTGVTNATLNLLDKGYGDVSAEKIAAQIEQLGADYDVDVTSDYSTVTLDGLAWHQEKLLDIFSRLLLKPDFKEKEIQRYKARTIAEVKQRTDQLNYLASEAFEDYFYENHPYGHRDLGSIVDIQALTRKDLQRQYARILRPDHVWITVVGQYSDDFVTEIEKAFSTWMNKNENMPNLNVALEPVQGHEILLIDKSDAAQAEIRLGHKMIDRQSPDYVATMVANSILGQGFSSRLMNTVRVKEGLTYSITSDLAMQLHDSSFKIKTFTKNESVGKTLSETFRVYEDFYKNGVTQQELDEAKNYLIGKFPMLVETPERLAFNLMILRLFHVSDDYIKNYRQNVGAVTLKQVNQAIHKNFDPQNMKIVIVANKNKVLDQIKDLGKLKTVEANQFIK